MIPKRISRKIYYSSPLLDLCLDTVGFNSNKIVEKYHIINLKNNSVVVIVKNNNDEICFLKVPRYTTQKNEWELPAGGIEKGEKILKAGKREVLEETGYIVKNVKIIYTFNPANSISNQRTHILFAKIDERYKQKSFDKKEVSKVLWISEQEITRLIIKNKINDGISLLALLLFFFINK